ncbi:MAG: hypothetical protein KDD49_03850 [Bacteroidetes bacterium]|nr:hypothetical protein [Bacteroidota bacterium]
MGKLNDIISGWKSYLINDPIAAEIAKGRAKVCSKCDEAIPGTYEVFLPENVAKEIKGLRCNVCSCPLSTSTRSRDYKCPLDKWNE